MDNLFVVYYNQKNVLSQTKIILLLGSVNQIEEPDSSVRLKQLVPI